MCPSQASILLLVPPQIYGILRSDTPQLRYSNTFPCELYLKNEEEKRNEGFLPSEKKKKIKH